MSRCSRAKKQEFALLRSEVAAANAFAASSFIQDLEEGSRSPSQCTDAASFPQRRAHVEGSKSESCPVRGQLVTTPATAGSHRLRDAVLNKHPAGQALRILHRQGPQPTCRDVPHTGLSGLHENALPGMFQWQELPILPPVRTRPVGNTDEDRK